MRRWIGVAAWSLLLVAACTIEMPEESGDPAGRGRLEFSVLFDDGEPAPGFSYRFEPGVGNSGGVFALRNTLTFRNFPAQEYEFTFTHNDAAEPVSSTVTVLPETTVHEEIRLPRG